MSSILGIFHRDGKPATHNALVPPLDALKHNVYDSISTWMEGSISFGHMMLGVTPEAKDEILPLTIDGYTITADARIDNRDEMFDALSIPPSERETTTDSLLILRAYQTWGKDCAQHLVGDYAFAVWDSRQQSLFCARDHIGVKPFYYYLSQDIFAFASDLRALVAFEDVHAEIDETEIGRYLISLETTYTNNTGTFLKDIYKLPFAHWLMLDGHRIELGRYWTPTDQPEIHLRTLDDYADHLFELVQQAVSARLRTNFPIGSHLSGGIDSSSIAVIASHLLRSQGRQISVFSWSPPPTGDFAETEHRRIEAICRQEGLTPVYTERTPADSARVGNADIVITPVHAMAMETSVQQTAATLGIRLMLSGWGGDETISFNGRGIPLDWIADGRWGELLRYLGIPNVVRHPRSVRRSIQRSWENIILPLFPDEIYVRLRRRQLRPRNPFINPTFEARIRHRIGKLTPPARTLSGVHATQLRLYAHGHITARLESWAAFGAEQGITYAFPLLDRHLMEFAYRLPTTLYLQDGRDRYLFRYTMSRILPDGVAWDRVKEDVSLLRRAGTIAPELAELERQRWLDNEQLRQPNPWVNVTRLRASLLECIASQDWSRDFNTILIALNCLEIWDRWLESLVPQNMKRI